MKMFKKINLLPLMLIPLIFTSCDESVTTSSFHMDTVVTYDITAKDADALTDTCDGIIAELESKLSAHIEDSEIARFNRGDTEAITDKDAMMIVATALDVYYNTRGTYDITVAPLVKLWNIVGSGEDFTPPTDDEIASELSKVGSDKLYMSYDDVTKMSDGTEIDLGGIAKGYALGVISEKLTEAGASGTVSFGGSVAVIGEKKDGSPYKIGIKDPAAPDTLIGVLEMESGMTAVSGAYERFAEYDGVRYHHIIDPATGYPSDSDLASAAVIVDSADRFSGTLCDALSTALFILGSEDALTLYNSGVYDFEAVLIKKDGSVILTDGLCDRYTAYEK